MSEAQPRDGYEVTLSSKRKIVIVELNLDEVQRTFQLAGEVGNEAAKNFRIALEGLRLSIRKIGDKKVDYTDLEGARLQSHFKVKEILELQSVWNRMHMPDKAEADAIKNGLKAVSGV